MGAIVKNFIRNIPLVYDMKRQYDKRLLRASLRSFDNQIGFWRNGWYALYHLYCRVYFLLSRKGGHVYNDRAEPFRTHGFMVMPSTEKRQALVTELEKLTSELYADSSNRNTKNTDPTFVQIVDPLIKAPKILELLDEEVERILEQYFRSSFKIFRVALYRTLPNETAYAELRNAWRWHSDGYPREIIKVITYLTNTDKKSGALRVHPRRSSRLLIRKGFFDRYAADEHLPELEDVTRYRWLEGPAGTTVFFDDNLVHRATPPEAPYHRDVVAFEVMPSTEHWKTHYERMGEKLSSRERHNQKWHRNPAAD